MSTPIRVYYCADMDAPTAQISPSAQKPQRAVESWGRLGIPLDIKRTMLALVGAAGGWTCRRKKFSSAPSWSVSPVATFCPANW